MRGYFTEKNTSPGFVEAKSSLSQKPSSKKTPDSRNERSLLGFNNYRMPEAKEIQGSMACAKSHYYLNNNKLQIIRQNKKYYTSIQRPYSKPVSQQKTSQNKSKSDGNIFGLVQVIAIILYFLAIGSYVVGAVLFYTAILTGNPILLLLGVVLLILGVALTAVGSYLLLS
jgi:hypothetical protein